MSICVHLYCGTGDLEVQTSGNSICEPNKRKEAHKSWPASMISFNVSEDIEGRWEILLMRKHRAAS